MGIPDHLRTIFEFREQRHDERARFQVTADTYAEAVQRVMAMVNLTEAAIRQMDYSAYQLPAPQTASGCGCEHE